jgi:cation diffusion facilitator family transporter
VVNAILGGVKLAASLVTGSFALLADAVNSLGDCVTSVIILFALYYAQRPADAEHPYGHTRAEAVVGSNVALLVMLSALWVGFAAIGQFGETPPVPPMWTLIIAAVNVVVKESLYRYKIGVGRRLGSAALIANAWDHRSDALCSMAVFIGLAVVIWGGPEWAWVDAATALVVVAAILFSAGKVYRESFSELLDRQADDAFVEKVRAAARSSDEVYEVETLRVRKSGMEYFVDIHIEVDPHLPVAEGHRISHEVKAHLLSDFPQVRDVLVHVEPRGEV